MALNENMAKAYLLKEDFTRFYACMSEEEAKEFLKGMAGTVSGERPRSFSETGEATQTVGRRDSCLLPLSHHQWDIGRDQQQNQGLEKTELWVP